MYAAESLDRGLPNYSYFVCKCSLEFEKVYILSFDSSIRLAIGPSILKPVIGCLHLKKYHEILAK